MKKTAIFLASGVICMNLMFGDPSAAFAQTAMGAEPPLCGGIIDNSDPNAPKTIESDELTSFSLDFLESGGRAGSALPVGNYSLQAVKTETGAHFVYDFRAKSSDRSQHYEKDLPAEALAALQALIRDVNLAACNGQSKRNSALGTYVNLRVDYADGEFVTAYGEGGVAAEIDGFCGGEPFALFFLEKLGVKEEALATPLNSLYYNVSNFNVGNICSWYVGHDEENWQDIVVTMEQPSMTGDVKKGKVVIPPERWEALEKLIYRLHMKEWMDLPRKGGALNDDEDYIGITLNFDDKQGSVNSAQALPQEAGAAFHDLRVFLEETYMKYSNTTEGQP